MDHSYELKVGLSDASPEQELTFGSILGAGISRTVFLYRIVTSGNGDATCECLFKFLSCTSLPQPLCQSQK